MRQDRSIFMLIPIAFLLAACMVVAAAVTA
jgi:hypothetical protein